MPLMDHYNNKPIRFLSPMKPFLVRMLRFTCLFACFLTVGNSAFAFSSADSLMSPSAKASNQFKSQNQPQYDVIKVAAASDLVPYSYVDKGKPTGFVVEIWELWAKKNNPKIEFVPSKWVEPELNVVNQTADVDSAISIKNEGIDRLAIGHEL